MSLRLALGRLIATPMFTAFAVLSLAAGVAVTTAVYSVVDSLFLRDMGIADPDRVVVIGTPFSGRVQPGAIADPDFEDLKRAQTSFSHLSASMAIAPPVTTTAHSEVTATEAVDGAFFGTLGIAAALGRPIQPADADESAKVAVISHELWLDRFAGDTGVIGRTIRVSGQGFEIVGVAPPGFRGVLGPLRNTRLWIPLASEPLLGGMPLEGTKPRDRRRLQVFARLAPGVTPAGASAEVATIARQLDAQFPPPNRTPGQAGASERSWRVRTVESIASEDNALHRFGMTLVALVALVLVVACTNLANLVLARGTARQGELAVRMAMGASRGRLIWEQCLESLLLATAGMVASYVMFQGMAAWMTTDFVMGLPFGGNLTLSIRPGLNAQALGVAVAAMALSLAVFGLEPAIQLARTIDIRGALASSATGIRPRVRRQRMVIRWQVAIAAAFFIIATMFIRATIRLSQHDPGVETDRIAVAALNFEAGIWDEPRIRRAVERVLEELRKSQDIEAASASTGLPFGVPSLQAGAVVATPDEPGDGLRRSPIPALAVTPSLFRTLGIPIVRGRGFTDADDAAAAPAVILSELGARQLFGSSDAAGRSVRLRVGQDGEKLATVVGVARDTDVGFIYNSRPRPLVYLPLTQVFDPSLTIVARSTGGGERAVPALREAIRRADPDLAVKGIGPGDAILSGPFQLLRSGGLATLYLGGFTLLLSMVGLFGVQSHVVAHRTREIGVRMSVGASGRQIKMMVLKDGYRPVLEGLVLGLWGGTAARLIARAYMDVEVNVVDPVMLAVTPIPLILAAFWACYLPASRAASVDPTVALRCE